MGVRFLWAAVVASMAISAGTGCDETVPVEPEQHTDALPGATGEPGQSVTSASLPPGDPQCPHGGSRFTSISGETYACHGAPAAVTVADGGGLAGTGSASFPLRVLFDGSGTAALVARADHHHDDRYLRRGEFYDPGEVNDPANELSWTRLRDVPSGFADGVDHGLVTVFHDATLIGDGEGVALSVNPTEVQRRVSGTCAAGEYLTAISEAGAVSCAPDQNSGGTIVSVNAGTGLVRSGTATDPVLSVDFGATLGTVAAGDDPRLSDSRDPRAGSPLYIQNQTAVPQPASFSISGSASVGAGVVIGGSAPPVRALEIVGTDSDLAYSSTNDVTVELRSQATQARVALDLTQGSTDSTGGGTPDYSARIAFRGDLDDSVRISVPNASDAVIVRADATGGAWLDGAAALTLALAGVCAADIGGAAATHFAVWEPGDTRSCAQVCADPAQACNGVTSSDAGRRWSLLPSSRSGSNASSSTRVSRGLAALCF